MLDLIDVLVEFDVVFLDQVRSALRLVGIARHSRVLEIVPHLSELRVQVRSPPFIDRLDLSSVRIPFPTQTH